MDGRDISVLHVIAPAPFGGAESVVKALAVVTRRADRPFRVAALLQHAAPSAYVPELREQGASVAEIRCGRRRYPAEACALARLVRDQGADLIHTHIYHADFVGYWAARASGLPIVATVHGHTSGSLGNRFYEWMDRRLLRRFDAVICVSESVRTALLRSGCPDDRLHVIENAFAGVAPLARDTARRALGVDGAARLAGWVGRLSVEKGADLFVDAFAKLAMSDAEAVLIGDGAERARVEAHAAAAGVAARVRFVGQRSRAAQLLTAFDVLVLSSRTEGTPMVLLEAMAAGVPVVAFAVGGVGRLIDASCGWLVPAGDTRALSEAISEALMQADEAKARARVAQRVLEERFGAARWLDELDALWERVVAAGFGHTRRPTFRVPRGA